MVKQIVLLVLVVLLTSGCETLKAVDYEFGDIHRIYCGSTNKEMRAEIKATLEKNNGIKVDVNYCASFNLVDALLIKPIQNKKHKEI